MDRIGLRGFPCMALSAGFIDLGKNEFQIINRLSPMHATKKYL